MKPTLTHLRQTDYRRASWKNGLGWTDQIAIHPPQADLRRGDFRWRLSTAHVAQSAPFSVFSEHDRVLVVLEGEGVTLSHSFAEGEEPEVAAIDRLQPYEFPGDVPTHCELRDGPIQDFSVFIRKGEATALVDAVRVEAEEPFHWEPQAPFCFVFAVEGSVECEGIVLQRGEALRLDFKEAVEEPITLRATGDCAQALLVQIASN